MVRFLNDKLLKEIMLISPIIGAYEIIQFVTVMASSTFFTFIISYLVRLSLLIGLRTYVDPILKNWNFFLKKFGTILSNKHKFFEKRFKKFISKQA